DGYVDDGNAAADAGGTNDAERRGSAFPRRAWERENGREVRSSPGADLLPAISGGNAMNAEIATIKDSNSGASPQILGSQGFNLFKLTAMPGGRPLEVLYAPEGFETGQLRPSKGGIPLLFPFPGRIAGTTFTWEGKPYQLEPGDAFGNAIHGFVLWRPWRVV